MKRDLSLIICALIAALAGMIANAQTTTFSYTATAKVDRFDEYSYFIGAQRVISHTFDETTGSGTVVYDGKVTELADSALSTSRNMSAVVIPEGITTIGSYAFLNCSKITTLRLPHTLSHVKTSAFFNCSYLSKGKFIIDDLAWWCGIVFDNSNANPVYFAKHIYSDENTEITEAVIPEGVTAIGDYAFNKCEGITAVSLPSSLTTIGENAFAYTGLVSVDFPESLTEIKKQAFNRCSDLKSVTIPEGVVSIGYYAFSHCGITSLTLPSTIRSMDHSFYSCSDLAQLTLSEGITSLGYSFSYIDALTSVHIPSTVILKGDFTNCPNLASVTIAEGATVVNGFNECDKLASIVIPSTVTKINGLLRCPSLRSITIPKAVNDINGFKNCTALEKVVIEDLEAWCRISFSSTNDYNPQYYAKHLFLGDNEIINLVIPETITKLRAFVFNNLTSITTVRIPGSVTNISGDAFRDCSGVEHVFCSADPMSLTWNGKGFKPDKATLFHVTDVELWKTKFPDANVTFVGDMTTITYTASQRVAQFDVYSNFTGASAVSTHEYDSETEQGVVVYAGRVTALSENALYGCNSLASIALPEGIRALGSGALGNCGSLATVILPSTIETIAAGAFTNSNNIADIYCFANPADVAWYGNNSTSQFKPDKCTVFHVNDVTAWQQTFPDANVTFAGGMTAFTYTATEKITAFEALKKFAGATDIVSHVFSSDTGEGTVIYKGEVTALNSNCFSRSKLVSIVIPPSVTRLEISAFDQCTELISVSLPESINYIDSYVFYRCYKLSSISIPKAVSILHSFTFADCQSLQSVTIHDGVNRIFGSCFSGCTALKSVVLGRYINKQLSDNVFSGCTALEEIRLVTQVPFPNFGTAYDNTFAGVDTDNCVLYVPRWQKEIYQNADVWREFSNIEEWEPYWWPLRGDVNIDWIVNSGDISALYRAILSGEPNPYCDINGDGQLNTGDVSALYGIILSGD